MKVDLSSLTVVLTVLLVCMPCRQWRMTLCRKYRPERSIRVIPEDPAGQVIR